jgi:two-component system sensor histidine kinase TtrS
MRNFVQPTERLRGKTEINELVLEISELCGPECRRAGVTLAFDLQTDPMAMVYADPIQVQQVLVNLVHNAVQAIDAAACAERLVTIRTRQEEALVELEVDDTGPGFAEAELEAAFRSFYTTRPDGLGLGLAISRSIVHDHGSELWIVPKPDCGARVIFTIPRHSPEAARDLEPADCVRD